MDTEADDPWSVKLPSQDLAVGVSVGVFLGLMLYSDDDAVGYGPIVAFAVFNVKKLESYSAVVRFDAVKQTHQIIRFVPRLWTDFCWDATSQTKSCNSCRNTKQASTKDRQGKQGDFSRRCISILSVEVSFRVKW